MRRLLLVFRVFRCYRLLRYRDVRRFLYAQLAFFAVVTLFFFTYRGIVANRGDRELRTTLAELDAKEPRWRWEQIVADRATVPDERNGVNVLEELVRETGSDVVYEGDSSALSRWAANMEPNRLLEDDEFEIVQEALKSNAAALPIVRRLRDYPQGTYPLPATLNDRQRPFLRYQGSHKALVLLDLEAEHRGSVRAATLYPRMMLNLERYFDSLPTFEGQFERIQCELRVVRRVERLLAMGEPQELEALQADVLQAAEADRFWKILRHERALAHELYGALAQGKTALEPKINFSNAYAYHWGKYQHTLDDLGLIHWMYTPRIAVDQATFLRIATDLLAKQTFADHQLWPELDTSMRGFFWDAPEFRMLVSNDLRTLTMFRYRNALLAKARLRCAGVALALERFRQDRGYWPETLAQLRPKYLATIPLDPFDGLPLKYTMSAEGVIVYSIGSDRRDNRGRAKSADSSMDRDYGVRLFEPDQRGLPPLPLIRIAGLDNEGRVVEFGPEPREVPNEPEDKR